MSLVLLQPTANYELNQAIEALKDSFSSGLEGLDRMAARRKVVSRKLKARKTR